MNESKEKLSEDAWQAARKVVLARDNFKCAECSVAQELHVHHLIPRHLGGGDAPSNLITLCSACHAVRHPNLQVSLSRRFIERWALRLARLFDVNKELPENSNQLSTALRILGKDSFIDGQLQIVLAALRGESLLVVRPTGSGKSLCFQIPAILSSHVTFVLTPLKALMQDQVVGLQRLKIPATYINSDLRQDEKTKRYELLKNNSLKLLYLTPERLDAEVVRDHDELEQLFETEPSYLVIDEAHCVDRWGDDFRPSYGKIHAHIAKMGAPPILAFTATAGIKAQKRIISAIGAPNARVIVSDIDRPNIALVRYETDSDIERFEITKNVVDSVEGKVMIFVPTKRVGEEVSAGLMSLGLSVPFYHGQLNAIDREFLLNRFTGRNDPEINVVICTNAFGMGLDIPNVRAVIHWMQPESIEDYLQEFGRAGRDRKPSTAIIFKSKNDDTGLRKFMAEKNLEAASKRGIDGGASYMRKLESINELDLIIRNRELCFRKQITSYFQTDIPQKISLTMRILEWLFSHKTKTKKANFCCDFCNPYEARKTLKIGVWAFS